MEILLPLQELLGLGIFLYGKEIKSSRDELSKKARQLYEVMSEITSNYVYFDAFIKRGEKLKVINAWELSYYDISHLVKYEERKLKQALDYFFKTVDRINNAIECKDFEKAKMVYDDYFKSQKYNFQIYNYMDAMGILRDISSGMEQSKPWIYSEKKKIGEYADRYFDIVCVWIYNYMLKYNKEYCKLEEIRHQLIDWLLLQPEIKEWVSDSFDFRKVDAMLFEISIQMGKRSHILDYCWSEYSIK